MKKHKISIYHIICAVILIAMVLICIYPILWMILGSMKEKGEFYTNIWDFRSASIWIIMRQHGKMVTLADDLSTVLLLHLVPWSL